RKTSAGVSSDIPVATLVQGERRGPEGVVASRETTMLELLSETIGAMAAAGIRQWVRLTGRRIARRDAPWLDCPMGPRGRIGPSFYTLLAEREQLRIEPSPDAGLLPSFDALRGSGFDPSRVRPEVRDFYEHTSCYRLEAW